MHAAMSISRRSRRYHVVAAGTTVSACGLPTALAQPPLPTMTAVDTAPVSGVPQAMRCRRHGCRQRWPA